ncbi:MGMT family protein [Dictyobacter arantiisoli]|uniref:Methylated-DNA-[protein]-cysteine S-methyltransferase DNA binding domain-containing protein n=1 Tax=Dictyobacter arantiisoli TaxID=2014874 RepID=A0A5A5TCL9_9CHLR|nr:MGMT family protein [Dictyobacter arantiisoli]GCF08935.1 hypothetical protein KDI_24990 [Dictyobacter arantiisoli]
MMSEEALLFRQHIEKLMGQVFALVQACPTGRVTTYGWIAKALGYPRGARIIGFIMHEAPEGVPAHRVVNSKGELTGSRAFGQIGRMRELLEKEGIIFSSGDHVNLTRYGWNPEYELNEAERQQALEAANNIPVEANARTLHLMQSDSASPFRA